MAEIIFKDASYRNMGACFEVFRAQVHNDLKATGIKLGRLVNFGHYPKVEYERIVH